MSLEDQATCIATNLYDLSLSVNNLAMEVTCLRQEVLEHKNIIRDLRISIIPSSQDDGSADT